MTRWRIWMAATTLMLVIAMGVTSLRAATSFDFLFSMDRVSNDRQYFLHLAVGSYGYRRADLELVLPRLSHVEVDLPVVLFLSSQSGRSVDYIAGLRARGLSWSTVFTHVRVPIDVLFVGIDRDPGPPYGRAWGHWKKNARRADLGDDDVYRLVEVQVGSRLSGVRPYELARDQRGDVVTYVAERKGRRYHDGSHVRDKDRGKGRGKDHHRPHDRPGR